MSSRRPAAALALATLLAAACGGASSSGPTRQAPVTARETTPPAMHAAIIGADEVRGVVALLAADSLEGRATGTRGSMKAATVIADAFSRAGLEPAGDSGYFQRVPMALGTESRRGLRAHGGRAVMLLPSFAALDTVPAERRLTGGNVVGILRGSDPLLRDEAILVSAHYDHLGIGAPVNGDSIYNGADDDASGTATVMLVARALAAGPRPRRSVVFLASTGEEVGLIGTRWYIQHPAWPLARTVANLETEMIGRPDSLAGGPGHAWLTGYERSTMGQMLRQAGIPLVADPRPAEQFFERSDNIAFAWLGIPAHTLSSFNLHAEYHTPADDVAHIDAQHMADVIAQATRAVRMLADAARPPVWNVGQRPEPPEAAKRMLGIP